MHWFQEIRKKMKIVTEIIQTPLEELEKKKITDFFEKKKKERKTYSKDEYHAELTSKHENPESAKQRAYQEFKKEKDPEKIISFKNKYEEKLAKLTPEYILESGFSDKEIANLRREKAALEYKVLKEDYLKNLDNEKQTYSSANYAARGEMHTDSPGKFRKHERTKAQEPISFTQEFKKEKDQINRMQSMRSAAVDWEKTTNIEQYKKNQNKKEKENDSKEHYF